VTWDRLPLLGAIAFLDYQDARMPLPEDNYEN
jgi:hypothetical protein